MNIFYVGAIVLTVFAARIDGQENKQKGKNKKKNRSKFKRFLGPSLTVGAMICTYHAAKVDGLETENKLKQIITDQATEIKKLNLQSTQQITGNGSYPIAGVAGGQNNGNKTQIIIGVMGEYALPNVTATIVEIPDYYQVNGGDFRIFGLQNKPIDLGTLRKAEFQSLFVKTETKETAVLIYFKSDNFSWNQSFRIVKTSEGRKVFWAIQDQNGKYLMNKMDKGFPVNENGEIRLWSNVSEKIGDLVSK